MSDELGGAGTSATGRGCLYCGGPISAINQSGACTRCLRGTENRQPCKTDGCEAMVRLKNPSGYCGKCAARRGRLGVDNPTPEELARRCQIERERHFRNMGCL